MGICVDMCISQPRWDWNIAEQCSECAATKRIAIRGGTDCFDIYMFWNICMFCFVFNQYLNCLHIIQPLCFAFAGKCFGDASDMQSTHGQSQFRLPYIPITLPTTLPEVKKPYLSHHDWIKVWFDNFVLWDYIFLHTRPTF